MKPTTKIKKAPFKRWRGDWVRVGKPDWREFLIPRMCRWLAKHLLTKPCTISVYGPAGLCCRVQFIARSGNGSVHTIALEPSLHHGDLWACRRLELPKTNDFRKGTIGYLNGMDYQLDRPGGDPPVSWFRSRLCKY